MVATLSDPEVTQRGKQYLDLKNDQWILLDELKEVLKPYEQATIFLSGQSYVTASVLPPLLKGLLKTGICISRGWEKCVTHCCCP